MVRRGALAALVALAACGGERRDPTEVVVLITTNLGVPAQLDAIRVEATGPGGRVQTSTARLDSDGELPVSLRLVHQTGPLTPLTVDVFAELDGADVLVRSAELAFVAGERRILALPLLAQCLDVSCGEGATCTEDGCADVQLAADQLPRYDESTFSELGAPPPAFAPDDAGEAFDAGAPEEGGTDELDDASVPDADADDAGELGDGGDDAGDAPDAGDAGDAGDCVRELVCRGACVILTIPGLCDCTLECVPDAGASGASAQAAPG
jgi:hypothetical protein